MSTFTRLSLSFSFIAVSTLAMPVFAAAAPAAAVSAYTFVVGEPYVSSGSLPAGALPGLYADLLGGNSQLGSPLTSPFSVNRILLDVLSPAPGIDPANYGIGDSVADSGYAIQFLSQLASKYPNIEVYAYLDIEKAAPPASPASPASPTAWGQWTIPTGLSTPGPTSLPSCIAATAVVPPPTPRQDILKSMCWANAVNQLIGQNVITGVAYEGQRFEDAGDTAWIAGQATQYHLKFGWISSGADSNADINFIEIYDKDQNHYTSIDTAALEAEYALGAVTFPGPQLVANGGEVSGNIYQCALDPANSNCTGYQSAFKNSSPPSAPDLGVMDAFNYIFNGNVQTPLSPSTFSLSEPLSKPIVFLFSTQYIGPLGAYAGSGKLCTEAAHNCACIASLYDSKGTASCGDENGFGAWQNSADLQSFIKFNNAFQTDVCQGSALCETGIYMYDYIPQSWFNGMGL